MKQKLLYFFMSKEEFQNNEWLLQYQIFTMRLFSFFFALGLLFFAVARVVEQNYIVGFSQLFFASFLLLGFIRLRDDKSFYPFYAISFLIFFYIYTLLIFFYVPQNSLNILWVVAAPIIIFFFLNKQGGVVMFLLISLFILYLLSIDYHYTLAEYVTLIAAFLMTSFLMYMYEKIKEKESHRLISYNLTLEKEIKQHTLALKKYNCNLEQRIEEEVEKRLTQEQMLLQQCRRRR